MGNQAQPNSPTKTNKESPNQPKPNQTNEMPDIASNDVIVPPQQIERRQLGLSQLANKFVASGQSKKASLSKVNIDPSRLLVSNLKEDKRYSLESEVVPVPFDVILATMDVQLLETFDQLGTKLKQYYAKEDKDEQQWKLHGNGFYINYELGHEVVIITNNMIYKGVVVTNKQKKIVPDEFGVLINKLGMYTGEFQNGQANGEGTYVDKKTMSEFKGKWMDGHIVDGMIVNGQYEFKGTFAAATNVEAKNKDNGITNEEVKFKANGEGAIRFKQTGASYIGNFVDGQYDTLHREIGRYKTQNYEYSGHFMKGKKEGEGILVEFPKSSKPNKNISKANTTANKKRKFRPTDKYDGVWQDDYFITTREERQKKKIRDIMLKVDIVNKIIQGPLYGQERNQNQRILENDKLYNDKLYTQKPFSSTKSDAQMFEIAEQQNIQSQL